VSSRRHSLPMRVAAPKATSSQPLPNPTRPEPVTVRESKVTVKIPRPLYRRIQQVVEESGFNSPTDFIVFVLRDLMGEAEASQASAEATQASAEATQASAEATGEAHEFSQDELDDVKRKLKNLGYL